MNRHALNIVSVMLWLFGLLFSSFALLPMSLGAYNLVILTAGASMLFLLVFVEASNTFLNPIETVVLAHQPIQGPAYFAAKLTYLVMVVIRIVVPLNVLPALAGLAKPEARWFYPLSHLIAACLTGLFVALITCASVGVLFRWLPVSRLRSAALWLQLAPLVVLPSLLTRLAPLHPQLATVEWAFIPLLWFHALALVGHEGAPSVSGWPAIVGLGASTVFITYGMRSLSGGFLTRAVGVLRSTGRARRRASRRAWPGSLVRAMTRRPSGRAAFGFVSRMMLRDWQFRRIMLNAVLLSATIAGFIARGHKGSPFLPGPPTALGLLPESIPLLTLLACTALPYSDHHRGRWIFLTIPFTGVQTFVRGVYWSLWLPFIALPLGATLPFLVWLWGLADALLFTAYALAVASLLFGLQLLLVEGLPFASPPRAERMFLVLPFMVFGPVPIVIGFALQWLWIFQSRFVTAASALVAGVAAVLAARYTLGRLEASVKRDLYRPVPERTAAFGGVSET